MLFTDITASYKIGTVLSLTNMSLNLVILFFVFQFFPPLTLHKRLNNQILQKAYNCLTSALLNTLKHRVHLERDQSNPSTANLSQLDPSLSECPETQHQRHPSHPSNSIGSSVSIPSPSLPSQLLTCYNSTFPTIIGSSLLSWLLPCYPSFFTAVLSHFLHSQLFPCYPTYSQPSQLFPSNHSSSLSTLAPTPPSQLIACHPSSFPSLLAPSLPSQHL